MKKREKVVVTIASVKAKRLVCAGLCLMSCLITSAQINLSFNPEKGGKYEYQMGMVQNIKQNFMGQEMLMESEMNGTYLMEIKAKTSQEIHVQFTYQEFTFLVANPMMKFQFDSKKPTENPSEMDNMFGKLFSILIGKPFTVIFTIDGSVKSVTGMDAIIKNMLGAIPSNEQVAVQMSQQFSDEAMKSMFGQSFNFYPNNTIKVGDSWDIESMMPMNNMDFNIKTKNKLKEVIENKATIEVAGDIEIDLEEGKFAGVQTGTMLVDTITGIPIISDILQNMKGTINAHGMEIQMEMIIKTKTSTKKIN